MPYPLTLATMLQRNRLLFGKKEVVVDAIPKTSVGKFAKRFLRDRFKEKRFA